MKEQLLTVKDRAFLQAMISDGRCIGDVACVYEILSDMTDRYARLEKALQDGIDIYTGHGTPDRAAIELWCNESRQALADGSQGEKEHG